MELRTPGYVLANLRTSYQQKMTEPLSLRFDAGIDNLTARNYVLPLGGRYYGPTMMAIKSGTSVPGMGRNFHGGLTFQF
jgi:outer membrane receptor protein involved in Fe transport